MSGVFATVAKVLRLGTFFPVCFATGGRSFGACFFIALTTRYDGSKVLIPRPALSALWKGRGALDTSMDFACNPWTGVLLCPLLFLERIVLPLEDVDNFPVNIFILQPRLLVLLYNPAVPSRCNCNTPRLNHYAVLGLND